MHHLIKSVTLFLLLTSSTLFAKEFNKQHFERDLQMGKKIILEFYAPWCSTCEKQHDNLVKLIHQSTNKDIILYVVDYDRSIKLKQTYRVVRQSTLILINKGKIVDKSIGVTDRQQLKQFIQQ